MPPRIGTDDEILTAKQAVKQVGGGTASAIELSWLAVPDDYVDPITGQNDFVGYRIYRSDVDVEGPWTLVEDVPKGNVPIANGRATYQAALPDEDVGVGYYWGVTSYDSEGLESGLTAYTITTESAPSKTNDDLSQVYVVPNPFRQVSGTLAQADAKRITFVNVPAQCTIRIYNFSGEHIQTIEHNGFGVASWGSNDGHLSNYQLTKFRQNVAPGLYFYHIESHVPGHEGENHVGKFVIIK